MKTGNFISLIIVVAAFSASVASASSALERLRAYAADMQSNEELRIEPNLEHDYEGMTLVLANEGYKIHTFSVQTPDGENHKAYRLTSSIAEDNQEWGVEYTIVPKCSHCEQRLVKFAFLIAELRNPDTAHKSNQWLAFLPSWQTTAAVMASAWFGAQYYKTGNARYALVSVASLGMLFVCPCNGKIRFGVCPQKMQSALIYTLGAAGAALAMLTAQLPARANDHAHAN